MLCICLTKFFVCQERHEVAAPDFFEEGPVWVSTRGKMARMWLKTEGEIDPADALSDVVKLAHARRADGHACEDKSRTKPTANLVRPGVPEMQKNTADYIYKEFIKLAAPAKASSGRPSFTIKVGTDCSGIDSPIFGLSYISTRLEEIGLDFKIHHRFSCDNNKHSLHFLKTYMHSDYVFDDLLARAWEDNKCVLRDCKSGKMVTLPSNQTGESCT